MFDFTKMEEKEAFFSSRKRMNKKVKDKTKDWLKKNGKKRSHKEQENANRKGGSSSDQNGHMYTTYNSWWDLFVMGAIKGLLMFSMLMSILCLLDFLGIEFVRELEVMKQVRKHSFFFFLLSMCSAYLSIYVAYKV